MIYISVLSNFRLKVAKCAKVFKFKVESTSQLKEWIVAIQTHISDSKGWNAPLTRLVLKDKEFWKVN